MPLKLLKSHILSSLVLQFLWCPAPFSVFPSRSCYLCASHCLTRAPYALFSTSLYFTSYSPCVLHCPWLHLLHSARFLHRKRTTAKYTSSCSLTSPWLHWSATTFNSCQGFTLSRIVLHMRIITCSAFPSLMIRSSIHPHSPRADLIRNAFVIIWDELPSMNKAGWECVDSICRLICGRPNNLFGAILFIGLGGFHQAGPLNRSVRIWTTPYRIV